MNASMQQKKRKNKGEEPEKINATLHSPQPKRTPQQTKLQNKLKWTQKLDRKQGIYFPKIYNHKEDKT